jgi:CRP-like cAMP-binding protein
MSVNGVPQVCWNFSDDEWLERTGVSKGPAKPGSTELAVGTLPVFFPKGCMLFLEGEIATGIFILRTGRAKESMVSSSGRIAIVRVVGPGAILGLPAVLTGAPHESTMKLWNPAGLISLRKPFFCTC